MYLSETLAVIGLSWAIASDLMGASRSCRIKSVSGWIMSRFTRIRGNRKELDVRLYSANRYKEGPLDRGGQGSRVVKVQLVLR